MATHADAPSPLRSSRLRSRHKLDHSNSLLTDRTFLAKAPKLIRASAVVAGREAAHPDDLNVLKLLTAFRVPDEVRAAVARLRRSCCHGAAA